MSEDLKISLLLFLSGLGFTAIISYVLIAFLIIPSSQPLSYSIPAGVVLLCLTAGLPFCVMIIGLCSLVDIFINLVRRK